MKSLCIAILSLLAGSVLDAQGSRLIEVKSADVMNVRTIGGQEVRELIGNVHIVQSSQGEVVKMWCDSALRYMETNKIQLFGDVKLVRDSVTLTSDEGVYYGNDRRAEMSKGVRLTRGGSVLTSKFGEYFADEKRARFTGDVHVVDSTSSTWSNALTYFETDEKSIAVGNVRVYNTENNLTVFGDSLIRFERLKYTLVPRHPKMVQVDTSSSGALDTMLVISHTMETYQDSVPRFIAQGEVQMVRTDLAAVCREATYFLHGGSIVLRGDPVVWHAENQLTGDSVVISTADRKLQSVYVVGRAVAISRADSVLTQRYDQLTAREITMYFAAGKIAHIDAERTATSLYYLFDQGEPNGANKSSGDHIIMAFQDGKVDQIRIIGGVEGKYYPETMIAGREPEYNLDGFRWITDRPKRQHLDIVLARDE
jgi:lipopolysaccharide export system protein LptA